MRPFSAVLPKVRGRTLVASRPLAASAQLAPSLPERADLGPDVQGRELYPFQREGVRWLATQTRALLADEMGLGKSAQFLRAAKSDRGTIVVCPASLRLVWRAEAAAWRPDLDAIVCRPGEFKVPERGQLAIVSYESLPEPPRRAAHLVDDPRVSRCDLGVDEAHYAKNFLGWTDGAWRALKVALLARQCRRAIAMTGTPIMSASRDLWGLLAAFGLAKQVFGNRRTFMTLVGATERRGYVEWPTELEDDGDVAKRLRRVMLRRLKADVMPDLPAKTYQDIPIDVDTELAAELDAIGARWGQQRDELPPLEAMSAVRARLARSRVGAVLETVERYEQSGEPLVVFSAHRAPIDALEGRSGWRVITGDSTDAERAESVAAFQKGRLRGIALTIAAGGVGITLTRARAVLFADLAWTPAENAQAEDRLVRIGQKAQNVLVMRMVADHPVDRRCLALLAQKQRLIRQSLDPESRAVA